MRPLRERNSAGEDTFQASDSDYEIFTSYFVPPTPDEGFNGVTQRVTIIGTGGLDVKGS